MELPVRFITIPKPKNQYVKTTNLSEQLIRVKLKKEGYQVTRGSMLDCFFEQTLFDEKQNAVLIRHKLVQQLGIQIVKRIATYCRKHHGTPDYLAFHPAKGMIGIEVKLGQEAIAPHQLSTMKQLMKWGLPCEVWKVMPKKNKVREKQINLDAWEETGNLRLATQKKSYERKVTVYGK